MNNEESKVVTLRPKGNRKPEDIAQEPEMKRLKELLDTKQVSEERLEEYMEGEDHHLLEEEAMT
jgi:hypothetical protein